jgi:hypothetical protein
VAVRCVPEWGEPVRSFRDALLLALFLAALVSSCKNDSPVVPAVVQEGLWRPSEVPPFGAPVYKIILGRNGKLFALIGGNVARSVDNGNTWSAVTSSATFYNLVVDKVGNLYAGANGVHRSTDDGSTWTHLGGDPSGAQGLALIANEWLLTVSYDGASCFRSTNSGQLWEQLHGIPGYGEYLIYNAKTNTVYLKTHYHGANKNLWSSTDNGATWSFVWNFSYTSNYPGFTVAVDSNGGIWTVDSDGNLFSGLAFETPIHIDGARVIEAGASGLLLVGGNGFQSSTNKGVSWVTNNSGMTETVVTGIGIGAGGMVLVGTVSGKIYRSTRPIPY